MSGFFPGLRKAKQSTYVDVRVAGQERDGLPTDQPELMWYHDRYPGWRSLFDGSALEEKISVSTDPESSSDHETYRWPVRYNLVSSYCLLHAGMLWGRGRTGAESNDLFEVRVDPARPGFSGRDATEAAPKLQDILQYFWSFQSEKLRPQGVIQQWAGGCVIKATWNPQSMTSVYGIELETIQPESFLPIWDPLNFERLYAVKLWFQVSKAIARAKYGVSDAFLAKIGQKDDVPVEEFWSNTEYYIRLGKGDDKDRVYARNGPNGPILKGPNPFIHPVRKTGVIPFVYVPRIRTGGFMGDSLAYHLEGLQTEINKTLADYGDALTRGAHPAFGISDFSGPGSKKGVLAIPRHGAMNLGSSIPGSNPPKIHEFPSPSVPPQTGEFLERLHSVSENVAGLTPAARGVTQSSNKSGLAIALEMLPTTNLVDWERAHWSSAIGGRGGLNEICSVIWYNKVKRLPELVPGVTKSMLGLRQDIEFRPVVPRDRLEIIDEVVRLATARAVSPKEWLRRLGDIEDVDEELINLIQFLTGMAAIEAAVAGRGITISEPTNPEEMPKVRPELGAESTTAVNTKQPSKQTEGQKSAGAKGAAK